MILLIFFIYNYVQISKFHINKPMFYSDKLNKDLRITQITDYHSNILIDQGELLDEIKIFNPHIIVLTGDMIDVKTDDIDETLNFIERIYEINRNIYFVIGNHELRNEKGDEFVSRLGKIGVTVLDNSTTILNIDNETINIIGISYTANSHNYRKTVENIDYNNYTILLSHEPSKMVAYTDGKEDVILSGHTHGGQVRLPFIGALVAPDQGLLPEYDKGSFDIDSTILYIDSGLGNSVFPLRFCNRVQISNIRIVSLANN